MGSLTARTRSREASGFPGAVLSGTVEKPRLGRVFGVSNGPEIRNATEVTFTVLYSIILGLGLVFKGMLGKRRPGRGRWVHNNSAQRMLMD